MPGPFNFSLLNNQGVAAASGDIILLMNNDAYQKLPEKARQAIDKNSGYRASRQLGAGLDKIYAGSAEAVRAMPAARECKCGSSLAHALITDKKLVPAATIRKLEPIVGKYFL